MTAPPSPGSHWFVLLGALDGGRLNENRPAEARPDQPEPWVERALAAAGVVAWRWDVTGGQDGAPPVAAVLRFRDETVQDFFDFVHPADRDWLRRAVAAAARGETPYDFEFRLIVPNDDSYLQHELVRRNFAKPDFWVCPPEHLNYFIVDTFRAIIKAAGFKLDLMLGEFPVDMFLFNPDSNYQLDPAKGKNSHYARIHLENMIAGQSIEKLIAFRKGCAEAGVGRDLVAYLSL